MWMEVEMRVDWQPPRSPGAELERVVGEFWVVEGWAVSDQAYNTFYHEMKRHNQCEAKTE